MDASHIKTEAELDTLVETHQTLLFGYTMQMLVSSLPWSMSRSVQSRFLFAVSYYDLQHKKAKEENREWKEAYDRFHALLPEATEGLLAFYVPNYCFLSLRNAGGSFPELLSLFNQAKAAAEKMAEPRRSQLLGFCLYNWSRLALKMKQSIAIDYYIRAGKARVSYYQQVKDTADNATVKSAATQVWKIRQDWASLFPSEPIDRCPVSQQLFDAVTLLADPRFSATK